MLTGEQGRLDVLARAETWTSFTFRLRPRAQHMQEEIGSRTLRGFRYVSVSHRRRSLGVRKLGRCGWDPPLSFAASHAFAIGTVETGRMMAGCRSTGESLCSAQSVAGQHRD